ncbi:MAG: tRNA (N6-threonylcarbamoyladenosine(37)-N6)-methyltransferase TrmO [Clostridia bacterium]|nr:tRNA (N6-threonylcarbamoyladenosine(37)-N6)-methyltransferase TrmO [Clostridia bacterium]
MKDRKLTPIGIIHTDFKEKFGIPRQSGRVKTAIGKIELYKPYNTKEAVRGLEEFSHIWLLFDFSLSHSDKFKPTVRPPRLGGNKRLGVFATRSPFRPNNIGLSSVKIEKINNDSSIIVSGVDLLDKTPIYDIKPYIPYTDINLDAVGGYSEENKNHRLTISGGGDLLEKIPNEKRQTVIDCICDDPRPAYQDDDKKEYSMLFSDYDIHFTVNKDKITIIGIDEL